MARMTLGAQISHMLKDRGVEVIFGIPGVHNQEMYRGIEEAGITHILARHEQGAGFMADGYARASGKPGVTYVITGPGLCNTMTPMGQAYTDSVPMLVLSSCLDDLETIPGQLHQMRDQRGAAETVCDWSAEAGEAQDAYRLIDQAFDEFTKNRPRPKHIQVPIAQLEGAAEPAPTKGPPTANRPSASPETVAEVAAALAKARRPMVILGGGALDRGPDAAERQKDLQYHVNAWLQRGQIASFSSFAARGLILPGHALNFGSYLSRPGSADVIAQADLLLVVGCELAEVDLWRPHLGHTCDMIRVDIDPMVLGDHYDAETKICADGAGFLRDLTALTTETSTDWDESAVQTSKAAWEAEVKATRPSAYAAVKELLGVEFEGCTIFSDMTQFAYVAKEIYAQSAPGTWHHPFGFGTLGYALPAAIGGKVALPDQTVIAIAGDYGFQYTLPELAVAVELGLSLPIILWDNGKLKEIEDSMIGAQIAPNAVVAQNPDFELLARAYGAGYVRPTPRDFGGELSRACGADRPTILHIKAEDFLA